MLFEGLYSKFVLFFPVEYVFNLLFKDYAFLLHELELVLSLFKVILLALLFQHK